MRTFVLGDIHGNIKALNDVLKAGGFSFEEDRLIFLGDVADGWDWVPECIDVFMKIKNFVWCIGNHDVWARNYFAVYNESNDFMNDWVTKWEKLSGSGIGLWLNQGGRATFDAYEKLRKENFERWLEHKEFWTTTPMLYLIEGNRLFVHGGVDWRYGIKNQPRNDIYYWDRDLWNRSIGLDHMGAGDVALVENSTEFMRNRRVVLDYAKKTDQKVINKVYIGHTVVDPRWNYTEQVVPQCKAGVWNLDTGAGSTGNACLLNINKGKYYLSKLASEYYPGRTNAKISYKKEKK